jgi:sterol desaturase/sphingolipid hydroxylase (fatty acid hydroxylase superfamily)
MSSILTDDLYQFLQSLFFLNDVNKRVYWLYLLSGFIIIIAFNWKNKSKLRQIFTATFSKTYWFNHSCYTDYKWIVINQLLKVMLFIHVLASSITISLAFNRLLRNVFGDGNFLHWQHHNVLIVFSLVLFICDDFSRFWLHRLYHRIPMLWRFHSVHHSATVLTPLTLYRVHSIEFLVNNCRGIIVVGTVSGLFMYCFKGAIGVYEVLGVNLFNLIFNLAAANLRHSHVWIGFGFLEHIFISPAQHQIHHSREVKHFNKNYGSCLSLWDKAFNSWLDSNNNKVTRFGL